MAVTYLVILESLVGANVHIRRQDIRNTQLLYSDFTSFVSECADQIEWIDVGNERV